MKGLPVTLTAITFFGCSSGTNYKQMDLIPDISAAFK
jgi:hypothetical protein